MIKRTLYFGKEAYLRTNKEQLVIVSPASGENKSVPIEDIGILMLDHFRITITSALLNKLLENNVAVISCNEKHLPIGMFLNLDGNSKQQLHFETQINVTEALKNRLWKQIITQKIYNQSRVLASKEIEHARLDYLSKKVKAGDPENTEGQAAFYYWSHLFDDSTDNFKRGRYEDPPNDLLNYGYAILRAVVARSLIASGLLPSFGMHHHNQYNAYCLADDIMEPYRPFVDDLVLELIADNPNSKITDLNCKKALLQIPVLDVKINGRNSPLMYAVQQSTSSLYACYAKNRKLLKLPVLE